MYPYLRARITTLEGVANIPAAPPYIVAANHVSFLDGPLIATAFYSHARHAISYLTRYDVWLKFGGPLFATPALGMIPVHPERRGESLAVARSVLDRGGVIGIFPQATRSTVSELPKAKTGVARLALATGLPVVPVGYQGPPGWTPRESIRNMRDRSLPITIRIGPPLVFPVEAPETHTYERLCEVTKEIMRAISVLSNTVYPH